MCVLSITAKSFQNGKIFSLALEHCMSSMAVIIGGHLSVAFHMANNNQGQLDSSLHTVLDYTTTFTHSKAVGKVNNRPFWCMVTYCYIYVLNTVDQVIFMLKILCVKKFHADKFSQFI